MPTTGIQSHDIRYLTIATVQYDHITNWSLSINGETIDITSFDSSGFSEIASGTKSWSWSCTMHYAGDATEGGDESGAAILAGTTLAFLCTTGVVADVTFGGNCKITQWELTGGLGESNKVNVSGTGTGALTISAVPS
jgi:predicted secreted protein